LITEVVEEAKLNFAMASPKELALPPLPAPLSRNPSQNRSRLPRRVLAASQIFQSDENGNITPMMDHDQSMMSGQNSSFLSAGNISRNNSLPSPSQALGTPATPLKMNSVLPTIEGSEASPSQFVIPEIHTPSRQRRATVNSRSPEPAARAVVDPKTGIAPEGDKDTELGSPSKRREKSKSHGHLLDKHIIPISLLEMQINARMFILFFFAVINLTFPSL